MRWTAFSAASVQRACQELKVRQSSQDKVKTRKTHPKVRSTVALGEVGELVLEALLDRGVPPVRVDVEDLATALEVRKREVKFAVESAWSTQGGVDGVRSVRRADHDDLAWTIASGELWT